MTYSMTCTCGHTMSLDAPSRDAAVEMFRTGMDQAALDAHWAEFHMEDAGPKPTLDQAHQMIGEAVQ